MGASPAADPQSRTVLEFPEVPAVLDTDVMYLLRGTGVDRDKRVRVGNFRLALHRDGWHQVEVDLSNAGHEIDLSQYTANLTVFVNSYLTNGVDADAPNPVLNFTGSLPTGCLLDVVFFDGPFPIKGILQTDPVRFMVDIHRNSMLMHQTPGTEIARFSFDDGSISRTTPIQLSRNIEQMPGMITTTNAQVEEFFSHMLDEDPYWHAPMIGYNQEVLTGEKVGNTIRALGLDPRQVVGTFGSPQSSQAYRDALIGMLRVLDTQPLSVVPVRGDALSIMVDATNAAPKISIMGRTTQAITQVFPEITVPNVSTYQSMGWGGTWENNAEAPDTFHTVPLWNNSVNTPGRAPVAGMHAAVYTGGMTPGESGHNMPYAVWIPLACPPSDIRNLVRDAPNSTTYLPPQMSVTIAFKGVNDNDAQYLIVPKSKCRLNQNGTIASEHYFTILMQSGYTYHITRNNGVVSWMSTPNGLH